MIKFSIRVGHYLACDTSQGRAVSIYSSRKAALAGKRRVLAKLGRMGMPIEGLVEMEERLKVGEVTSEYEQNPQK